MAACRDGESGVCLLADRLPVHLMRRMTSKGVLSLSHTLSYGDSSSISRLHKEPEIKEKDLEIVATS